MQLALKSLRRFSPLNPFEVLYQISHRTTYTYSDAVTLQPHTIRLCPRSNSWQSIQMFSLQVTPAPISRSDLIDLDGNSIVKVWFDSTLTHTLDVQILAQIATLQSNPFNYLLEPWALQFPIDYPTSLLKQLQPYFNEIDPVALQLSQEIAATTNDNVLDFLNELNQRIYQSCDYLIRETGSPLPPGITWTQKKGSCRDLTVLFMAACRSMQLAARFVSGYEAGDPASSERQLHAWAEVYLPGAGWRGYDPTHGLMVSDRHIALVASAVPGYTAPIVGAVTRPGGVQSTMHYELQIQQLSGF